MYPLQDFPVGLPRTPVRRNLTALGASLAVHLVLGLFVVASTRDQSTRSKARAAPEERVEIVTLPRLPEPARAPEPVPPPAEPETESPPPERVPRPPEQVPRPQVTRGPEMPEAVTVRPEPPADAPVVAEPPPRSEERRVGER